MIKYLDFLSFWNLQQFCDLLSKKQLINIETIKCSDNSEFYRVWFYA